MCLLGGGGRGIVILILKSILALGDIYYVQVNAGMVMIMILQDDLTCSVPQCVS